MKISEVTSVLYIITYSCAQTIKKIPVFIKTLAHLLCSGMYKEVFLCGTLQKVKVLDIT